ncbi:YhcH/YjgK/YiaL family protein [Pantoea dispersa]|uniref:YhcH/YjgK/YiaL family protein n=1 Tax=Pantoea dispersa TaxID=59814 RepID=UPI0039B6E6C7
MIVCDRLDWPRERHAFHPIVDLAIRWIADTDFSQLEAGKYDLLPNNQMFCLVQEMETEPASDRRAESHFNYVDIQYLLEGRENIGVARAHPQHLITEDLRSERDVVFYKDTIDESIISLAPGQFALFFPHDVHRPCCAAPDVQGIRKAVIKIHLDLFAAPQEVS